MSRVIVSMCVGQVSHRHGDDYYLGVDYEDVVNQVYEYVETWWNDEISHPEFPSELSQEEIVEQYFDLVDDEWFNTWDFELEAPQIDKLKEILKDA